MSSASADFAPVRFSAEDLLERDRIPIWREVLGRMMLGIDIEPLPGIPFDMAATLRQLPGLRTSLCVGSGMRLTRTCELVADGNDDFGMIINLGGAAVGAQRGRALSLAVGEATPIAATEPATFACARFIGLSVPYAAVAPLVTNINDTVLRAIPRDTEALTLLVKYLKSIADDLALATPELRRAVVTHVHDLIALAIGATRDVAAMAEGRGLRAARLKAIKADIVENLGRRDLTVAAVPARQHVSPRYVSMLFETEGITFSEFVLGQRLARAHRLLADPRYAARAISAIALESGFGDLSYFNRAFRRRYGASPSDVRADRTPEDA